MNNKKEKVEIGAVGAIFAFILVTVVVSIFLYVIRAIFLKYTNAEAVFSYGGIETNLAWIAIFDGIIVFISILAFMLVLKKFFIVNETNMQKFIKTVIIIITVLGLITIITNVYVGYKKVFSDLHMIESYEDINMRDLERDKEDYSGFGFAEGCKTEEEIHNARKEAEEATVFNYFLLPVIPKAVIILINIACLEAFSKVFFKYEKEEFDGESKDK